MPIFKVVVICDSEGLSYNNGRFHFEKEIYYVEADSKQDAIEFAKEKYLKEIQGVIERGFSSTADTVGIWKTHE